MMNGLEYFGALALLGVFFFILVNLGKEEDPDIPEFGFPPIKNKKKKKKKKKKSKKK
jgi:hypothetical protein